MTNANSVAQGKAAVGGISPSALVIASGLLLITTFAPSTGSPLSSTTLN